MRKPLAALAALCALGQAAGVARAQIYLPPPSQPVSPPPPVGKSAQPPQSGTELRLVGPVSSSELVAVGIGPDGAPVRVTATQRLRLDGTGDYSFVVPAPATSVVPGPGSQSRPGLRTVGILWQGFSDRHRVLSATATLRPAAAAPGLPLRVRVERRAGSTVVRLVNVARRRIDVPTGLTTRAELVSVLEDLRASYRRSHVVPGSWAVKGEPGNPVRIEVAAPLRVTGVIAGGQRPVAVDELLGAGRPLERSFDLPGVSAPRLRLRVNLLPPLEILPTAAELADPPRGLTMLQAAFGAVATSLSYRRYLDSPDPLGPSEASYVYRSVPKPAAVTRPARGGGSDTLAIVLAFTLGLAGLAGVTVLWARS